MTEIMKIYQSERERVERELKEIHDVKAATDCLCASMERMRLDYHAQVQEASLKATADRLFDVSKQSIRCMLAVSGAEIKVVQDEAATITPTDKIAALLPIAAMVVGAVLTAWMILEEMNVPAVLAVALTMIAWLETQVVYRRKLGVAARAKINEYELLRMMDRLMESLEDAIEMSAQEQKVDSSRADAMPVLSGRMLEPFQMLLEAAQTQDGDYALKAIPALRAAMQEQGIEELLYCEEKKECFDMYPSTEGGITIRPALVKDGNVVMRGQATEQME